MWFTYTVVRGLVPFAASVVLLVECLTNAPKFFPLLSLLLVFFRYEKASTIFFFTFAILCITIQLSHIESANAQTFIKDTILQYNHLLQVSGLTGPSSETAQLFRTVA